MHHDKNNQDGVVSNEVNKSKKETERKGKDSDYGKNTPAKKAKKGKMTAAAVYQEDQDVVTLQVEQDSEFEDGEIVLPTEVQRGEARNSNASALITENVDELEKFRQAKEDELSRKQADEEELKIVSKRIAGETFALVKEMMEESGLLETATVMKDVKERLKKSTVGEKETNKGEITNPLTSTSETTIYERAVGGRHE